MADQDDVDEIRDRLGEGLMENFMRRVQRGNTSALHEMYDLARDAKRSVDGGTASAATAAIARYLPKVFELATEHGVKLDEEQSLMRTKLLQDADGGNRKAQLTLAAAYEHGDYGIEPDPRKSIEYYVLAAEDGSEHAIRALYARVMLAEAAGAESDDEQGLRGDILAFKPRLEELIAERGIDIESPSDGVAAEDGEWLYVPDDAPNFE